MEIKEITGRNYYATKRRKQITDKTDVMDFLIKLDEEVEELKQSFFEANLDEKEIADVVLVCFALAKHYKIDLIKVMEEKMLYNEKQND
jgi:NTP pyrophosphatase (non-canonical NTP hydrolase)